MKRVLVTSVVAAVGLFAGAASAQSQRGATQRNQPTTGAQMQGGQQMQQQKLGVEIPNDPKKFAEVLHHVNQHEIRLGQLAQQKAQDQRVRQYGQQMVEHHQQADQQLMQLAKTQGWKLGQPKANSKVERAVMQAEKANEDALKALDGAAFDHLYMANMVSGHDMAILKATQATQQFQGTEVGKLTTQLMPVLTQHREDAHRILGELKPQEAARGVGGAGMNGESMRPTPGTTPHTMPHTTPGTGMNKDSSPSNKR